MNKVLTTALLVTVASSTVALAQPRIVINNQYMRHDIIGHVPKALLIKRRLIH